MIKFYDTLEEFISNKCLCNIGVGIATAAGIGAASSIYSSSKAAKAQVDSANIAAGTAMEQYNRTRADLLPYNTAGQDALKTLQSNNYYTDPIVMDQATLEATPGYQFTKTQGLKAVQNAAAARGLGVSGAALKGAASFATGLADNTYKTQFDIANINKTNAYNRLQTIVSGGQNAAAQTGNAGTAAANTAASAQIGAGNAQAAGWNAIGGSISNAANNIGGYYAYKGLYGSGGSSSSAGVNAFNSGNPIY